MFQYNLYNNELHNIALLGVGIDHASKRLTCNAIHTPFNRAGECNRIKQLRNF
jgi:hypothetical protein